VVIGGVERTAHFFALDLPHSDACYIRAYPAATAESWVDGHAHAFTFFGRVPRAVLYDNDVPRRNRAPAVPIDQHRSPPPEIAIRDAGKVLEAGHAVRRRMPAQPAGPGLVLARARRDAPAGILGAPQRLQRRQSPVPEHA